MAHVRGGGGDVLEYIRVAPDAIERLELWHEDKRIRVDPEKISAVTAA